MKKKAKCPVCGIRHTRYPSLCFTKVNNEASHAVIERLAGQGIESDDQSWSDEALGPLNKMLAYLARNGWKNKKEIER